MAQLPIPDPALIAARQPDLQAVAAPLWRLHTPTGAHPTRWDELRGYGPLPTARFDPWPPPPADRAGDAITVAVGYFAFDVPSCLAEVFQTTRHIATTRTAMQLSAFQPRRPLRLLDLRGSWPVAIGASHAINAAAKNRCRRWAQAIREAYRSPDGLLYTGFAGRDCAVVYAPPGDVFPSAPTFTRPLADPALAPYLADAAEQIGYALD